MKPHRILKSFKGSQTGHDHHHFVPGPDPVMLSDSLAAVVVPEGWAEPIIEGQYPKLVSDPDPSKAVKESEEKAEEGAPANKAIQAAPANKRKK